MYINKFKYEKAPSIIDMAIAKKEFENAKNDLNNADALAEQKAKELQEEKELQAQELQEAKEKAKIAEREKAEAEQLAQEEKTKTTEVEAQKNLEMEELQQEFEEELKKALEASEDMDLDGKYEKEEKEKKDHKLLKKSGSLLSTIMKMAMLGILVGSPMLGVLGILSIKYNQQVMDLCGIFNYKPLLIPNLGK